MDFGAGPEAMIYKAKTGHLMVVRPTGLLWKRSPWRLITVSPPVCLFTGFCSSQDALMKPLHVSSGDPKEQMNM